MRKLLFIFGAVYFLFLTSCNECRDARTQVLEPVRSMSYYLNTQPSGEELATKGCATIIEELKNIPQGIELIKKMAHSRFIDDPPKCIRSEVRYRWVCDPWTNPPNYGPGPFCRTEPYTVCLEEEGEDTREEGYRTAIQLSRDLEEMHAQAHAMCKVASENKFSEAEALARTLSTFTKEKVLVPGENIYRSVCESL